MIGTASAKRSTTNRVIEAFWSGDDERFAIFVERETPKCFGHEAVFAQAKVKTGESREGVMWRADMVHDYAKNVVPFFSTWRAGMEIETVATEAAKRAEAALERLDETVKKFRERSKNDLSSMKASSDRVQSEVSQMTEKYKAAQSILTAPDFERAIANAERLAVALKAISELSDTRLSVAVFGAEASGTISIERKP